MAAVNTKKLTKSACVIIAPYWLFSRRWGSMDMVDIVVWADENVTTIKLSRDFINAPFEVRVRKFVPLPGDLLELKWAKADGTTRTYRIPPYGLWRMVNAGEKRAMPHTLKAAERLGARPPRLSINLVQADVAADIEFPANERDMRASPEAVWLTIYLVMFMMLHSNSMIVKKGHGIRAPNFPFKPQWDDLRKRKEWWNDFYLVSQLFDEGWTPDKMN
ncbi:hypothetical protein B0T19DRAFT_488366 [Cercophora scortea]|uniref:Uncharacterized protein n=1 Tax=Cercophora scortea TaxID=314031 RepID=A0AAE0I805_9PEZI|nr:hypothetical protein B0T19DRAFT_488366 [Cercophora scortea]